MNKELSGSKVILKAVELSDATHAYASWLNDKEVTSGLATIRTTYTREMVEQYIKDVLNDQQARMFMILVKETREAIGTIKISNIDKYNGICNLGIMIGNKSYWRGGYGTDALKTAIDHAFNELNIRKICETVHSNNPAALITDLKIGFTVEGVLKEQHLYEGKYVDKILIALFARDWNRK